MRAVEEFKERISEIAALMDEFRLAEASLEVDGFRVAFRKRPTAPPPTAPVAQESEHYVPPAHAEPVAPPVAAQPPGTPISSPMTGIYYASPSPTSAPFVKEGESVSAGQVVGLIEAMKVFNEITATVSGKVIRVVAESGQLVQPGDPLLYVG